MLVILWLLVSRKIDKGDTSSLWGQGHERGGEEVLTQQIYVSPFNSAHMTID